MYGDGWGARIDHFPQDDEYPAGGEDEKKELSLSEEQKDFLRTLSATRDFCEKNLGKDCKK